MHEALEIARCLTKLSRLGEPALLATVVRVSGSAYRRVGARMLVTPAGGRVGCVSGGCLERDVRTRGARLAVGEGVVVTYDSTADADTIWSLSLGCNGRVDVLIERISPQVAGALGSYLSEMLTLQQPARLATLLVAAGELGIGSRYVPNGTDATSRDMAAEFPELPSLMADLPGLRVVRGAEILVESIAPPQAVVIFGGGWDAVPVASAAKALGWHVAVVDERERHLTREHFPTADVLAGSVDFSQLSAGVAAIVMTHDLSADAEALAGLLGSDVGYVGLLGSRGRSARLLESMAGRFSVERLEVLHAPVGLDLGGETPAEIAAAVVGEILAWRNGREGGSMRDPSLGARELVPA